MTVPPSRVAALEAELDAKQKAAATKQAASLAQEEASQQRIARLQAMVANPPPPQVPAYNHIHHAPAPSPPLPSVYGIQQQYQLPQAGYGVAPHQPSPYYPHQLGQMASPYPASPYGHNPASPPSYAQPLHTTPPSPYGAYGAPLPQPAAAAAAGYPSAYPSSLPTSPYAASSSPVGAYASSPPPSTSYQQQSHIAGAYGSPPAAVASYPPSNPYGAYGAPLPGSGVAPTGVSIVPSTPQHGRVNGCMLHSFHFLSFSPIK
jgi:hypothetical protein